MAARQTPIRHHRAGPRFGRVWLPLFAGGLALLLTTLAQAQPVRRFALVAGNNQGGDGTRDLAFATRDARKLEGVLRELGDVADGDLVLLLDREAQDFWRALAALEARIQQARAAGQRTVLLVYYSGHAKAGDLRLGATRIPIEALRQRLDQQSPADVRIGILDACRSGVVNRTKGARRAPAFDVFADGGLETRGLVLLTSSSADEDAQESDTISGSYFSYHLVNGLRGDADRSGDRRVTLSEAYDYAYARTVAETAETAAGAQHPTFSYDLKGNGHLVLSELGRKKEGLFLPAQAPEGVYYVVETSRGVVAAEMVKTGPRERLLALSPGTYTIKRRLPDRLRVGEVTIPQGRFVTLEEATLRDAPFSDDPVKGAWERGPFVSFSLGGILQAFFDSPTRESLFPPTGLLGAEILLHNFFRRHWVAGVDLAVGGTQAALVQEGTGAELPFRFTELNLGTSLLTEWPLLDDTLTPFVGGRLAFLLLSRRFEGEAAALPDQFLSTFSPGIVAGLRYGVTRRLSLSGRVRVHYLHYNIDQNRSLGYWEGALVGAYDL